MQGRREKDMKKDCFEGKEGKKEERKEKKETKDKRGYQMAHFLREVVSSDLRR